MYLKRVKGLYTKTLLELKEIIEKQRINLEYYLYYSTCILDCVNICTYAHVAIEIVDIANGNCVYFQIRCPEPCDAMCTWRTSVNVTLPRVIFNNNRMSLNVEHIIEKNGGSLDNKV